VIRVHSGEIREGSRSTQGVRLLRLEEGDRIAAAASILEEDEAALVRPRARKEVELHTLATANVG